MSELDPFGRKKDENPLAGLGSLSDGLESQQAAQPVVPGRSSKDTIDERWRGGTNADAPDERWRGGSETPPKSGPATPSNSGPSTPPPAGSPQAALRDLLGAVEQMKSVSASAGTMVPANINVIGRIVKIVILFVVLMVIVSAVAGVLVTGKSVKDGISNLPTKVGLPTTDLGSQGGADPVGLQSKSLLRRTNLAPALKRLRTSGLGRLKSLSIRPERVDAQLLTKDGRLRSVQVRSDGKLTELSVSGGGFAQLQTIPFARANSAAPARMARSAARRVKRPVSQVDYVVLIGTDPSAAWTVVMKGGGQFIADARGRITRRIG